MAYLDDDYEGFEDEGVSTFTESNGSYDSWEPSHSGEAIGPRYRRNYTAAGPRTVPRPAPARPVGGLGGATINTPAGRAQVRFEKPLATKDSVEGLVKELKREIAATADAVKRIDQTIDTNTSVLDKKILALETIVKKGQQGSQMGFLLPLLLSKPPVIEKITFDKTPVGGTAADVKDATYKKDDNLGLLIALMSMGGGGFGGNGSDANSLLPLILITTLNK